VKVSKSSISRRVKALNLEFRRGRKRLSPVGERPARSIFLDCAGAFFLKGAELEMGLLGAMNQLLTTSGTESAQARKVLKLTQQINALLVYAPVFGLETAQAFAGYNRRGLLYLTEQKTLPKQDEIAQYLQFLSEQKLLLPIIKEVAKICAEALFICIDFAGQTFYLDAQSRTVWPKPKLPRYFSATLNKTKCYIKDIFQSPSIKRPLILQTCPGYTFLPTEMFNLIQCFEKAQNEPISRIVVTGKSGENLAFWQDLTPPGKCFFLAPLSPWQYARLQDTQIVQGFRQYQIGPKKEIMSVADAQVKLFNPQLNETIRVRAALVRRKEERLGLITNISRHEERYIRKIAEQYFSRWPGPKIKTYYDLLEEGHEEVLIRSQGRSQITPLLTRSYAERPENAFRLFLEELHSYVKTHFFPSEYEQEGLQSMGEKFYRQPGFLKIKRHCWEIFLQPFSSKKLQSDAWISCQKFNQSNIQFSPQIDLRIYLQGNK